MIDFNKPYFSGRELQYIAEAIAKGDLSGDGSFSKRCARFFEEEFSFRHTFLTTSCTHALEMTALLTDIRAGDEVIMPSFTFVSTANAFALRGAKIIFADSLADHPNVDHRHIESLITSRTRAIVVVHYGGVACDMDYICAVASKHNLVIIEDAAHAIGAYHKKTPLGSIGTYGAFSFHESKNIVCGEGGMLVVNDDQKFRRAEIIREKGTDRSAFFRGEIEKYQWIDIGSSYLLSDILAAALYAQLESLDLITQKRLSVWQNYYAGLRDLCSFNFELPVIPDYATHNAHLFFVLCPSTEARAGLIESLKRAGIMAVFHYQPLHNSEYYRKQCSSVPELANATRFADTLVRLPLHASLSEHEQDQVIENVLRYAGK